MATALVDLYELRSIRFDELILESDYRPSDTETFMCDEQRAYFLRKLKDWKESIVGESRATMAQLQIDSMREPDVAAARHAEVIDVLDAALTKGPWLLGENFSAADIAIGAGLNFAVRLFKMVPSRPSFERYIDRCAARPAFQRASVIAAG